MICRVIILLVQLDYFYNHIFNIQIPKCSFVKKISSWNKMGGGEDRPPNEQDKGLFSNLAGYAAAAGHFRPPHGVYPPQGGYPYPSPGGGGGYPPAGYPPPGGYGGYPPPGGGGYPPQGGYPSHGYPPTGYPPAGYPPSGYPGPSSGYPGQSAPFQSGFFYVILTIRSKLLFKDKCKK